MRQIASLIPKVTHLQPDFQAVRQVALRVRISAQLIDATSGSHVWAERYDLELADVFAIQDEIAGRVAGAIEPELLKTELNLVALRHTGNMTAWDLVRQGTWYFHKVTRESHLTARKLFRQACSADPDLSESHIWLARVSAGVVAYGWSEAPTADIKEGMEAAARAIYLDAQDPYAPTFRTVVAHDFVRGGGVGGLLGWTVDGSRYGEQLKYLRLHGP